MKGTVKFQVTLEISVDFDNDQIILRHPTLPFNELGTPWIAKGTLDQMIVAARDSEFGNVQVREVTKLERVN